MGPRPFPMSGPSKRHLGEFFARGFHLRGSRGCRSAVGAKPGLVGSGPVARVAGCGLRGVRERNERSMGAMAGWGTLAGVVGV